MISSRHAPALCIALALALVPTVIHTYSGATNDDGRRTGIIPTSLADIPFVATDRPSSWGQRVFESDDWFERQAAPPGKRMTLTVVRSYDLKRLYHHPELTLAYGTGFVREETVRLTNRAEIPVRVLYTTQGNTVAVSAIHYGNDFVENPILFQVRIAGELLFSARKAMTLFFVQQQGAANGAVGQLDATRVLFAAIDRFLSQRSSPK